MHLRGLIWHYTLISGRAHPHALAVNSGVYMGGYGTTLHRQWGSLFRWAGAFHIREVDHFVIFPDMGVTYPFHSPHFCLALHTVTQFCDWSHSSWGSLSTSINGYRHCSLCLHTCSFGGLQPHHITCGPHPSSVDALVDVHGRSHNFFFFHPREALLVGHWVIALPLSSCDILFFPPLTEEVLHGVGLVHLSCD